MKKSPEDEKIDRMLKNQRLTPGGFFGTDTRELADIITSDGDLVESLGKTCSEIAARMQEITEKCIEGFESEVKISDNLIASETEAKGSIVCPWPHPGRFPKRVTTLKRIDTGRQISWSDLNIHLIAEHGFFEGKGTTFRLEPDELIQMLW